MPSLVQSPCRHTLHAGDHHCLPQVGYTIRFDDKTSPDTRVKFATDGMLLRCVPLLTPGPSRPPLIAPLSRLQ